MSNTVKISTSVEPTGTFIVLTTGSFTVAENPSQISNLLIHNQFIALTKLIQYFSGNTVEVCICVNRDHIVYYEEILKT